MSKHKNNKHRPSLLSPEMQKDMEMMLAATGFELTYTPRSLLRLERQINQMFPIEGPSRFPTTYLPLGYYLGETIRRNIPEAKWVDNDDPFEISVTIPVKHNGEDADASLLPFLRVAKFFEDRSDGLKAFYDGANLANLGMLHNKGKEDQWNYAGEGLKWRVFKAPKGDTPNAENEPEK